MAKTTKAIAEKILGDVSQDKQFWCHDGRTVKNLNELTVVLREMPDETFSYHVNGEKNDFSSWIRDVIGDATLAKELQKAVNQNVAARKVEMRLDWLRARL